MLVTKLGIKNFITIYTNFSQIFTMCICSGNLLRTLFTVPFIKALEVGVAELEYPDADGGFQVELRSLYSFL